MWPIEPACSYASVIRKEDRWNNLYLYKLYVNFEENEQLFPWHYWGVDDETWSRPCIISFPEVYKKKKELIQPSGNTWPNDCFCIQCRARPCSPLHSLLGDSWVLIPCPELFHWEWMEQTESEPSNVPASSAESKNERKFPSTPFLSLIFHSFHQELTLFA